MGVLAELIPTNDAQRIRGRSHGGVDLRAESITVLALDHAASANQAGVETGGGWRDPQPAMLMDCIAHRNQLILVTIERFRVNGRPVISITIDQVCQTFVPVQVARLIKVHSNYIYGRADL